MTGWQRVSFDWSCSANFTCMAYVSCPLGKQVLGGGLELPRATHEQRSLVEMSNSFPLSAAQWQSEATNNNPVTVTLRVWAICATTDTATSGKSSEGDSSEQSTSGGYGVPKTLN